MKIYPQHLAWVLLCFHFIPILSILFSFFEETFGQDYKFPPFFSFVCPCVRVCTFMCRCVLLYVIVSMCVGQRSKSSVFFSLSTLYFETISHSQSLTTQLNWVTRDPRDPLKHPSTHWGNRCCLLPDFLCSSQGLNSHLPTYMVSTLLTEPSPQHPISSLPPALLCFSK